MPWPPAKIPVHTERTDGHAPYAAWREGKAPMIMTIASGKGGTGKTTLAVNLAHVLAR